MTTNDWPAVEIAARQAGWCRIGDAWVGPCPVTGVGHTSVEPGYAADGVFMRCSNPVCISPRQGKPQIKLGLERYLNHKAKLLAALAGSAPQGPRK